MLIAVPKELKNGENRVALTPQAVAVLIADGHGVQIERQAGIASGFSDDAFKQAGAQIVEQAEIWAAELVVKVKEPLPEEYHFLRKGLQLFTYLHLAAAPELLQVLLHKQVRALAYETVALENGFLPLLAPMSQVAGRVSMLMAAQYLRTDFNRSGERPLCCKGMLLGGVPGIDGGRVTILGAGEVGRQAALVALALGSEVVLLDCQQSALNTAKKLLNGSLYTAILSDDSLQQYLPKTDVLVGAALITGARAPQLLSAEYIAMMDAGSVFMDVAIDQGGVSTTSRVTSYDDPIYSCEGVWHCCLPNFPACVPHSSSLALVAATLSYIRQWVNLGLERAIEQNSALAKGVNSWDGAVVHPELLHLIGS